MKLEELLTYVSTGQMIRVIMLNDDGEETGQTLEFENDKIYLRKPNIRNILGNMIESVSSTEDDYLRIEVYE